MSGRRSCALVRMTRLICLVGIFLLPAVAAAHESQPGLLELHQLAPERWEVVWRAPIYYGKAHPARLALPEHWR